MDSPIDNITGTTIDLSIPRRCDVYRRTATEHSIGFAMSMVEKEGAHPLLTDAIEMLRQALEKVADYVDLPATPVAEQGEKHEAV